MLLYHSKLTKPKVSDVNNWELNPDISNQYAKILSPFIEGANNTEIKFVINKHGKLINLLANSNMHNIILKILTIFFK